MGETYRQIQSNEHLRETSLSIFADITYIKSVFQAQSAAQKISVMFSGMSKQLENLLSRYNAISLYEQMNWHNYIEMNPRIQSGKPVISGTRITVELIIEKLSEGESIDQILESHQHLERNSILACLSYAADSLKNELYFPKAQ